MTQKPLKKKAAAKTAVAKPRHGKGAVTKKGARGAAHLAAAELFAGDVLKPSVSGTLLNTTNTPLLQAAWTSRPSVRPPNRRRWSTRSRAFFLFSFAARFPSTARDGVGASTCFCCLAHLGSS